MTEDIKPEILGEFAEATAGDESISLFPTLDLIAAEYVNEDGIDFEGLTTKQLLDAAREAYLMHHQALQELAASMQTLGLILGHLDDRIESTLSEDGEVPAPSPTAPAVILPSLVRKS